MKVYAIQPKQVTFRDDDTYMPPSYDAGDAMIDLSRRGYVIKGQTTRDAFEKLHDDITSEINKTATAPSGVWFNDWANGYRFNDKTVKFAVKKWGMKKEDFASLLTRFWEANRGNRFINQEQAISNFLTNFEGLSKPSFFENLFSRPTEYISKKIVIDNIVTLFLKNGKHQLK